MMARRLFTDLFGDQRVQFVLVDIRPGANMETTRAAIAARYGEEYQLVIFTLAELRRDIAACIERAFLPTSALLVLSVVVGCLGIANALAIAVEERSGRSARCVRWARAAGRSPVSSLARPRCWGCSG